MNKIQLFRLLRQNKKLSEKRNVMFEANQYGKFFAYLGLAFFVVYFVAIGTFLGWLAATEDEHQIIFFILPFLLLLDFGMRFMAQQTPVMMVKPYMLMPISKYSAVDCFLVSMLFDSTNLIWLSLFLPYTFICICGSMTLLQGLGMLILLQLIMLVNSQWYLLVRTLVNRSMFWLALPIVFYGATLLPFFLLSNKAFDKLFDRVFDFIGDWGFTWAAFLVFLVLFVLLFIINRHLQMHLIYDEISKHEETNLKHVSEFTALNRFGQIGEYLKLEIKSTMRNKAIRARFIQGVCFITFFSLAIAFLDIYRTSFERNFFCLYCFVFFGAVNLTKVMCPEGNYIDLLMVHEENILTLLRAKYYYYCAVLLLPFLITLVPVIMGKFSLIMVLAYLFTVTGPIYFLLFQMAIYNKQTLPLNEKLTGKNQMENKWQIIVSMTTMFAPVIIISLLQLVFSADVAYWILFLSGLATTLTEPYWLRNIYRRMMLRRYENLEGFHASR